MPAREESAPAAVGDRCAIVIASAGRSAVLEQTLRYIDDVRPAGCIVILSVPDENSLPAAIPEGVKLVIGTRGVAAQRNRALDVIDDDIEFVIFFDDDSLPHPDFFEAIVAAFDDDESLAGATGNLLADGAVVGALTPGEGHAILADLSARAARLDTAAPVKPIYSLYGCNFVARASLLSQERFDERLPLYSWLEDEDLSQRLARRGGLAYVAGAHCVHLAVPSGGRTDHLRYGYSQVSNALYLRQKGSITRRRLFWLISRPVSSNMVGSLSGLEAVSRRRRLHGNVLGGLDALHGQVQPERILSLPRG